MKFVTILLTTLLATSALAFTGHVFWEKTFESHESARGSVEFRELQEKYPHHFQRVDPERVESASVATYRYRLRGDTVCDSSDARANWSSSSASVCYKSGGSNPGMCSSSMMPMPPVYERDPCANK